MYSTGNIVAGDRLTYVYEAKEGALTDGRAVNAGSYSVTAVLPSDNYAFIDDVAPEFDFEIAALEVIVTLTAASREVVYGDVYSWNAGDFAEGATVTNSEYFSASIVFAEADDLSGISLANTGTEYRATLAVTVSKDGVIADVTNYIVYGLDNASVSAVVIARDVTFTASAGESVYDGAKVAYDELITLFSPSCENFGDVLLKIDGASYDEAAIRDAGVYEVTLSSADVYGNYKFAGELITVYTVTAKTLTAIWSDTYLTYNGLEQAPVATAETGIAGETVALTVSGAATVAGEAYVASAEMSAVNANYVLDPDTATAAFTIAKATLTDITSNVKVSYDGTAHAREALSSTAPSRANIRPSPLPLPTRPAAPRPYIIR